MNWRLLDTGDHSGAFNMALDERLATDLRNGLGPQTLRLFGWKPWAVSLGFNQSEGEIDREKCNRDGIDVVRRPTGGRAILHARELTYSVVMFSGGRSVLDVYHDIGRALVRGLHLLGVNADMARSTLLSNSVGRDESRPGLSEREPGWPESREAPCNGAKAGRAGRPGSPYWRHVSCFASTGRYEVCVEGKKLVGSAQRRYGGGRLGEVVLQHGSILVGPEHRRLVDYIAVCSTVSPRGRGGVEQEKVVSTEWGLGERSTELESIVGRDIDLFLLRDCLKKGFEEEWEISLIEEEARADCPVPKGSLQERDSFGDEC